MEAEDYQGNPVEQRRRRGTPAQEDPYPRE